MDDLATSCKNLMNFGPATPKFKRGKGVLPLLDQQFGCVRLAAPLLDLAGISSLLSFVGRSVLSFVSVIRQGHHCYAAQAIHAGLCHAFTTGSRN